MRYKNRMRLKTVCSAAALAAAAILVGCNTDSNPPLKPFITPPAAPATSPTAAATTQPTDVVAELSTLKITRADLDQFLYQSYGLRMLFDLVELDLAKATLNQSGGTLTPAEIATERQNIITGICKGDGSDAPDPSTYETLFTQFLQREHITRAEFDLKIVQTDAYLRKIVTPLVVGKMPEADVRRGFEALYGAKRAIADIELANVREAEIARGRLKTEPFERVAVDMSIDPQTAPTGGRWQPFSDQDPRVPQVIKDSAFSLEKGQVSDIIVDPDSHYHLIKVLDVIDPKLVKYEAVRDQVRKQLEDQLITLNMKKLREQLNTAMGGLKMDDPVLQDQWNAMIAQNEKQDSDREGARRKMNDSIPHPATQPGKNP
jgi:hypothetical protein